MSVARLFGIVYHLLNKGKSNTIELADLFEVSTRTILRDINKLSSSGIPIWTEPGRHGGISLLDSFVLDKVILSKKEQDNILVSLKGMKTLNSEVSDQSFIKLYSLFNSTFDDWLEIDFSSWQKNKQNSIKFEMLKKSILSKKRLTFTYVSAKGKIENRVCNPYKLIFKGQSWYLYALCLNRNAFRYFKINRMSSVVISNDIFHSTDLPLQKSNDYDEVKETIPVTLSFSKDIVYRVYDEFDHNAIKLNINGKYIVKVNVPDNDWLIRYLLSFGKHVEIIEPLHLKNQVKNEVEHIYINMTD